MKNKFIKQLALASYTKNKLDQTKVNKIIKNLTRLELKKYIKAIKNLEKQKVVYVYSSIKLNKLNVQEFKKIFTQKEIVFLEDKSLLAGIKVVNNDLVYENNLSNNFENLINYLNN